MGPFSIKLKTRRTIINTARHKIHAGDVYFAEIKPSAADRLSSGRTAKRLEIQPQFSVRVTKSETQKARPLIRPQRPGQIWAAGCSAQASPAPAGSSASVTQ